jgi:hypothetical protein
MKRIKEADAKRLTKKAVEALTGDRTLSDHTQIALRDLVPFWEERETSRHDGGRSSAEARREQRDSRLNALAEALERLRTQFPMRERFTLAELWAEAEIPEVGRFTYIEIAHRADELRKLRPADR